jgi:hypothetical protein
MTTTDRYPAEVLDEDEDDGTMPQSLAAVRDAVVGRRIVAAERSTEKFHGWPETGLVLTLDDGTRAMLVEHYDCCAYTEVSSFLLDPASVDHVITGVGTTDGYTTWHIYADFGDVMTLNVGWSCGNPFYYGYGLSVAVFPADGDAS